MITYFKNPTVRLHVFCDLNTQVKFCANRMLFTIQSVNVFFLYIILDHKNFKFKHLIDNISVNFLFSVILQV